MVSERGIGGVCILMPGKGRAAPPITQRPFGAIVSGGGAHPCVRPGCGRRDLGAKFFGVRRRGRVLLCPDRKIARQKVIGADQTRGEGGAGWSWSSTTARPCDLEPRPYESRLEHSSPVVGRTGVCAVVVANGTVGRGHTQYAPTVRFRFFAAKPDGKP